MGKKVLIINDKTLKRRLMRYTLSKHGYEVIEETRKGHEAVVLYNKYKPDLVALDINRHQYYKGVIVISLIDSKSRNMTLEDAKHQDLKFDYLEPEDIIHDLKQKNKAHFYEAI
ncbi:response regulator [Pelotomaculum propionicicum]|uniref:response regulator n=1 Tax=Pelotomaculum propionicicum TaxID=258475 RepID=UPI003B7F3582